MRQVNVINQQPLLTLALFAATEQPVVCGFGDDVDLLSRLHRQLFAGPLFVGECWDDGHLVQHPNLPFVLAQIEKTRTFTTTIGLFLSSAAETITKNASACSRCDIMDSVVISDKERDKL